MTPTTVAALAAGDLTFNDRPAEKRREWFGAFSADDALRFAARWVVDPRIVDCRRDPVAKMAAAGYSQYLVEFTHTRSAFDERWS